MKFSNLTALMLPFVLLLVLIASVIATPRINNARSSRHAAAVTTLPETVVTPADGEYFAPTNTAGAPVQAKARVGSAPLLRTPNVSLASDFDFSPGH